MPRLAETIPALPVVDISKAVGFYDDRLGFAAHVEEEGFAIVRRDAAELHLWASSDERWREKLDLKRPVCSGAESFLAGTASCRIRVSGIDELYDEYRQQSVLHPVSTGVEEQPWGTREFPALDLHGNLLTFFERVR